MKMWMIYDREGLARNKGYVEMYHEICKSYGIAVEAVLTEEIEWRITGGETPVFVLVRTIQPKINRYFEEQGIPVFNSYHVSKICNDKGKTLDVLRGKVLCVPSVSFSGEKLSAVLNMETEGLRNLLGENFEKTTFVEKEQKVIREADDFVIKAVDGHGGTQVFSVMKEKNKILAGIGSQDFVLQPMIRGGNYSRDMRVYVIGKRIVAAVMRSSRDDFRANFSLGGGAALYELTAHERENVNRVLKEFDFGMVGIDFIFDNDNQIFLNEIEDVVGARMLYQCAPHIDIAKEYIEYILREKLHIV